MRAWLDSFWRRLSDGERLAEFGPVVARVMAITAIVIVAVTVAVIVTRPRGAYEVEAVFDSARGLIEGGEVTAGRQPVGTITEIWLDEEDNLPHVKMRITDGDFRLHQGAVADAQLASNVGAVNRVVDLTQGDTDAPELEDGAVLGPSKTDEPVDLDLAVSTLDPKTRRDAGALLAGLDRATRGRGPDLNRLLQHSSPALNQTANVLAQVSADGAALRSLVANGRIVVGALARDRRALGATAERLATLLQIAGGRQAELRRTTDAIGPAIDSGAEALANLNASVPELRELVRRAKPLVNRLEPIAPDISETVASARPLTRESRKFIKKGPIYAKRILPGVKASIPVLTELGPMMDLLNPFLDHQRVRMPEVVGFFALAGDATANYDRNGHLIRFIPRMIQFPQYTNEIGPSDTGPGLLIPPFERTPGALEGEPWENYHESFIGGGQHTTAFRAQPPTASPWRASPLHFGGGG